MPNDKNCRCNTVLVPGRPFWECRCLDGSEPVNNPLYGPANFGRPLGKFNDGEGCCQCIGGPQPCPGGRWDPAACECVPNPTPTPTPAPSGNPEVCIDVGLGGAGGGNFESTQDGSSTPVDMGCSSPVLVDVAGDGFRLTSAAGGVLFDLNGDGAGGCRGRPRAPTTCGWHWTETATGSSRRGRSCSATTRRSPPRPRVR